MEEHPGATLTTMATTEVGLDLGLASRRQPSRRAVGEAAPQDACSGAAPVSDPCRHPPRRLPKDVWSGLPFELLVDYCGISHTWNWVA